MTPHLLLDFDRADMVPGAAEQRAALERDGFRASMPRFSPVLYPAVPDSARAHEVIKARLARAGYRVAAWTFERSTNGWHATVVLDPPPSSPMEIVALQAICGSDPSRESCNVERARHVQEMGAHAARVLRDEGTAVALRALAAGQVQTDPKFQTQLLAWLDARAALGDSFWLDRWNVLYAPNPAGRK